MPVVLIHHGPTVTAENYRATVQKLAGKDKLESVSDWPVGGILFHSAGESPSGFRVVDVWESQDACDAFGQRLGPILEEVGITDPPEMYPAETFVSSQSRSSTKSGAWSQRFWPLGSRGRSRGLETLGQRRREEASSRTASFSWEWQARTTGAGRGCRGACVRTRSPSKAL